MDFETAKKIVEEERQRLASPKLSASVKPDSRLPEAYLIYFDPKRRLEEEEKKKKKEGNKKTSENASKT